MEKPTPRRPRKRKIETSIRKVPATSSSTRQDYLDVPVDDGPAHTATPGTFRKWLGQFRGVEFVIIAAIVFAGLGFGYSYWSAPSNPTAVVAGEPAKTTPADKPADAAKFVLLDNKKFAIVIKAPNGSVDRRYGGSVSWRQNNPGLLAFGNHSKAHGALDVQNNASVFPTYEHGRKALETYLFETDMKTSTLTFFVRRLYPKDIEKVFDAIVEATGADSDTKLMDLTPKQKQEVLKAIEKTLDFRAGNAKTYATEADWKKSE
jgi:hypothetical protein